VQAKDTITDPPVDAHLILHHPDELVLPVDSPQDLSVADLQAAVFSCQCTKVDHRDKAADRD
jgi:hypothetical protein